MAKSRTGIERITDTDMVEQVKSVARAALTGSLAKSIPAYGQFVPSEPTDEMISAARDQIPGASYAQLRAAYIDMLIHAPQTDDAMTVSGEMAEASKTLMPERV
jgi:hypothetical protein